MLGVNQSLMKLIKGPIYLLTMPSLSPSMKCGVISKYYGIVGQKISQYHVLADIYTYTLTNTEISKKITLELEMQDEMYISKILCPTDTEINVGKLVAVFCEEKEDMDISQQLDHNLLLNTYLEYKGKVRFPAWQAYVKSKDDSISCG
jgi:pyruvate/2-oxoglutarate dehydrogenase complex dihydrolipoamide acyltransferase (E2) component